MATGAWAQDGELLGAPVSGKTGFQPAATELARDLRVLVRERLMAGDSDAEVIDFVVDRYGEYVLLRPTTTGSNWMLWAAGPLMFLIAVALGWVYLRGRAKASAPGESELSAEEQDRLRQILDE